MSVERIVELERLLCQANTEREDWKRWCLGHETEIGRLRAVPAVDLLREARAWVAHGEADSPREASDAARELLARIDAALEETP